MNKLQKVIAIITILSVSSCGEFFYHNEQVNFNKKFILKKPKKYCSTTEEKSSLELAGSNVKAVKIFKKLIQTVPQIQRLSLIELSVMWSLFQLNIRPDLVSPTSRLQMLVKIKKSVKYFQFDEKTSQTPFLNGLNYLLKKYRSKKSINKLASLLYRNLPRTIPIDNDFSVFLKKNESELQKYDQFKTVFFKAAHVIKRGESIPKLNFRKLVSKMHKKTRISPRTHLFTSRHYKRNRVKCNIDLDLYHNNIFLI